MLIYTNKKRVCFFGSDALSFFSMRASCNIKLEDVAYNGCLIPFLSAYSENSTSFLV